MHLTFDQFFDPEQGFFFFTPADGEKLFARNIELIDNVIPASNSSICRSLFRLGHIFHEDYFLETSQTMMAKMKQKTLEYPASFSNWGIAFMESFMPFYTIAIAGSEASLYKEALNQYYLPFTLKVASTADCFIPLLQNRNEPDKTMIHICAETGCLLPTEDVNKALILLGEVPVVI
jgi:uncharacterized protein YyaL (SSP411 family)